VDQFKIPRTLDALHRSNAWSDVAGLVESGGLSKYLSRLQQPGGMRGHAYASVAAELAHEVERQARQHNVCFLQTDSLFEGARMLNMMTREQPGDPQQDEKYHRD